MSNRSCAACRALILNSLIPTSRNAPRPFIIPSTARRTAQQNKSQTSAKVLAAPFSSFRYYSSAPESPPEISQPTSEETTTSTQPDSTLPWYLQIQPPEPPSTPFASSDLVSQEIPPIPEDAPTILEPILKHLSISIGLDNLSLIDLRDLDPPAALGSNLLMILGTARSHKHLNTSADRFCRWLRATYNLRPYADGLLGRNELKLKLRRQNRKLKLAQSVGNTLTVADGRPGADDGITTGWICCNLGTIEEATVPNKDEGEEETITTTLSAKDQERIMESEDDEYVNPQDMQNQYHGFGQSINAPKIVVQMFLEEKRIEMDLEGLWDSRIRRREGAAEKGNEKARQKVSQAASDQEPVLSPNDSPSAAAEATNATS